MDDTREVTGIPVKTARALDRGDRRVLDPPRLYRVLFAVALLVLSACAGLVDEDESIESESSTPAWKLPASVRAAGALVRLEYDGAPLWRNGRECTGQLRPGARALGDYIEDAFDQVVRIEGYACRPNTADERFTSVHGIGRAIDIRVPVKSGGADPAAGDPIANWLVLHAAQLGVQRIIWNRTIWRADGTNESRYSGKHPHHDHVHAELTEETAAALPPIVELDGSIADASHPPDASWPDSGKDAGVDSGVAKDAGPIEEEDSGPDDEDAATEPPPANSSDAGTTPGTLPDPRRPAPDDGDDPDDSQGDDMLGGSRRRSANAPEESDSSGCNTAATRAGAKGSAGVLLLVALVALRRRRSTSGAISSRATEPSLDQASVPRGSPREPCTRRRSPWAPRP
jgi:MYXO-CTERM domain-containing protein